MHLEESVLSKLSCLLSERGSTVKERICSLLEQILSFQNRLLFGRGLVSKKYTRSHKNCLSCKTWLKLYQMYSVPLMILIVFIFFIYLFIFIIFFFFAVFFNLKKNI